MKQNNSGHLSLAISQNANYLKEQGTINYSKLYDFLKSKSMDFKKFAILLYHLSMMEQHLHQSVQVQLQISYMYWLSLLVSKCVISMLVSIGFLCEILCLLVSFEYLVKEKVKCAADQLK